MISKSLIVNQLAEFNNSNSKPIRGLATFVISNSINGNIKVFNISDDLLPVSMVVKVGEQKFTFEDIDCPQNFDFKLNSGEGDITMLLATKSGGVVTPLAMAHTDNVACQDYSQLFEELEQNELDELIEETIHEQGLSIDTSIDASDSIDASEERNDIEETQTLLDVETTTNFYALIQPQLDELFTKFPHFKELEELVANTEWVKVNYTPNEEHHYILGKLYDGAEVTHLCYGIPSKSRFSAPPESLAEYCQWLPKKIEDEDGEGYWVMYQNARTGENIKL